uniref:Uncharacterized protein n=1 Tax=Octopus bimaculoides TaxID=37653 RepID=A0A0L8FIE6_OCTBM
MSLCVRGSWDLLRPFPMTRVRIVNTPYLTFAFLLVHRLLFLLRITLRTQIRRLHSPVHITVRCNTLGR